MPTDTMRRDELQPIDIVYTWVDGSDPAWRARQRLRLSAAAQAPAAQAVASARYEAGEDLRFSMRSVAAFAPWVRTIHLVTDAQVPAWLDTSHPRIRVVDHREIFAEPENLPTFNSAAIVSQLHRIPELAERFVFLNDDVFFGRPVRPGDFFDHRGRPFVYTRTWRPRERPWHFDAGRGAPGRDALHLAHVVNSRDAVRRRTGVAVHDDLRHVSLPMRRSVLEAMERELYADAWDAVAASPFRAAHHVAPGYLFGFHLLATAQGRRRYLRSLRERSRLKGLLHRLAGSAQAEFVTMARADFAERLAGIERDRPAQFCVNDAPDAPPEARRLLAEFLHRYFPRPSPYERAPDAWAGGACAPQP